MCARAERVRLHRPLTDEQFAELLLVHSRLVWWFARRAEVPGHEPEDVAQQTFLLLWRRRAAFDPARPTKNGRSGFKAFVAWTARSAVGYLTHRVRRKAGGQRRERRTLHQAADPKGKMLTAAPAHAHDPAAALVREEATAAVERAVGKLADYQRAVVRAWMDGKQIKDVYPGRSRQLASCRLKAACRDLQEHLAGHA